MFSDDKWGPNERGPIPFVKLCRFGGSGFDVGKERFVAISTNGAWEGECVGELEVSDGEVVLGDVVVVEEDDDEVFSEVTLALSNTCLASSVTLFFIFVDWQAADSSTGNKGESSSGVGGAILLWIGCELVKNNKNNLF